LQGLFEEDASGDGSGGHMEIGSEGRAAGEAVALVKFHGGVADVAGFQDDSGDAALAGFGFESSQDCIGDASAAGGGADVHAFDFGEVVVGFEGDAAAADGFIIQVSEEEEDVGLEDFFEAVAVALFGGVFAIELVVQFGDESADVGGWGGGEFDLDIGVGHREREMMEIGREGVKRGASKKISPRRRRGRGGFIDRFRRLTD